MNAYATLQAKEIHYIVRLLELDTQGVEDVVSNIDSIKLLASSLLDKCATLEREMYALSDDQSTQEEIDAVNAHLQSLYATT